MQNLKLIENNPNLQFTTGNQQTTGEKRVIVGPRGSALRGLRKGKGRRKSDRLKSAEYNLTGEKVFR